MTIVYVMVWIVASVIATTVAKRVADLLGGGPRHGVSAYRYFMHRYDEKTGPWNGH